MKDSFANAIRRKGANPILRVIETFIYPSLASVQAVKNREEWVNDGPMMITFKSKMKLCSKGNTRHIGTDYTDDRSTTI